MEILSYVVVIGAAAFVVYTLASIVIGLFRGEDRS